MTTDLAERGSFAPFDHPQLLPDGEREALRAQGHLVEIYATKWPTRFAFAPDLGRALATEISSFDIVHVHSVYVYTSVLAARLARSRRIPYIVRPHGSFMPHLRRRSRLAKSVFHRFVGRPIWDAASAIHYTSERERDEAADIRIEAPAMVIPLGVDISQFAELPARGSFRAAFPSVGTGPLIVYLGRLAPRKGIDLLIRAFAEIAPATPESHLVVAGPDEFGYENVLKQELERLGLRGRVSMPGLVTGQTKASLLADADIWVLPSLGENFGIAVVEALAAGCPVLISSKVDVLQELGDRRAVEVCEPEVASIRTALDQLLRDGERRAEMSNRARRAAGLLSWEARIGPLVDLYSRLAPTSARPVRDQANNAIHASRPQGVPPSSV